MEIDKRRLERVVANLVGNAETHGQGCVGVRVPRSGRTLRSAIDDEGPGIAPELRERVFQRFARGSSPSTTGVGLGLAIVQRHVELHGGTISVLDAPGGRCPACRGAPPRGTVSLG